MAPMKASPNGHESSSMPLADYFWIAGLDGQELMDTYVRLGEINSPKSGNGNDVNGIIVEDEAAEAETSSILESPRPTSKQSKRHSYKRLSRLSGVSSEHSSTTIRLVPPISPHGSVVLSDVDFDKALKKFATDRESFYLDISFSAGAVTQPGRQRPRPRTQKIVTEDQPQGLSRGIGSVRRHMSFRERSSAKRQSSIARQGWFSTQIPHVCFSVLIVLGSLR